jgi:hypothetical protein
MITNMIIAALFLVLIGLAMLSRAVKSAPAGYQDEDGFHEGFDPRDLAHAHMMQAVAVERSLSPRTESLPSLRRAVRAQRKRVAQEATHSYPY